MKRYLAEQDPSDYIVSFEEKEEGFLVKLDDGSEVWVDKTEENRQNLLTKMENQFYEVEDKNFDVKLIINNRQNIRTILIYLPCAILEFCLALASTGVFSFAFCAVCAYHMYQSILAGVYYFKNLHLAQDFFQINYFLENQDLFNDKKLTNEQDLDRLKRKTKDVIKPNLENQDRDVFDINNVSQISFNEFDRLGDMLVFKKENNLENNQEIINEEKGIQRTRRKK